MASGLVIHIEFGQDKHTEVLSHDRIRIGSCEGCDLRLKSSILPTSEAPVIELARTNGHYRVVDFHRSLQITHNGAPLAPGTAIEDGDELRFGQSDLALQFFPIRDLPGAVPARRQDVHVAPFIEHAAIEAAATARRDDAKVFLREFTRELIREINTSTKIITLLIATALVLGVLYLGFGAYSELHKSRQLIDEQNQQLGRLKDQLDQTNQQFTQGDQKYQQIIDTLSLAPRLRSVYGDGVCLIAGSYIFVEPATNRPLRYPEIQSTEEGTTLQNGLDQAPLTPEGKGDVYTRDYVGTGFHVGDGFVVTNRHVAAEPWMADEGAMNLSASVNARPRLARLVAYFPGRRVPVPLRLKQASPRDDLAVCALDMKDALPDIPTLPLDKDSDAVTVGKEVVMMGYPSGADRVLATLPEAESRSIQQRYGASQETLLSYLADRNFIKPLTTRGHITDLEARRIVYDARTAEGGSGAPLFGQSGRVIGVGFAIFTEMPDANFAVPIRYVIALLERAGWKRPEMTPAENAAANNAPPNSPKDARSDRTAAAQQSR